MSLRDCWILIFLGLGFCILGVIGIVWGRHEARKIDEALVTRRDLREFVAHWPEHPQPGALVVGGWVAIAVGFVLFAVGVAYLWLLAHPGLELF